MAPLPSSQPTSSFCAPAAWMLTMPEPSATQQPVRTMSRIDCAAFLYGDQGLNAAWECKLSDRPVWWLDTGWGANA